MQFWSERPPQFRVTKKRASKKSLVHLKMKENTGGLTGATDTIPQGTGSSTTATSVGTLLLSVAGAVSTIISDAKRVWKPGNKHIVKV